MTAQRSRQGERLRCKPMSGSACGRACPRGGVIEYSVSLVRRSRSARGGGLDARPVALLDPSTDPDTAVFELPRLQPGGEKLRSWRLGGDRERLRPSPSEIHVDRASAFADRQHLAFHHVKWPRLRQKLGPALGPDDP